MRRAGRLLGILPLCLLLLAGVVPVAAQTGSITLNRVDVLFEGREYSFLPGAENLFEIDPALAGRRAEFRAFVSFTAEVGAEPVRITPKWRISSDINPGAGAESGHDPRFFDLTPGTFFTFLNFENTSMRRAPFQVERPAPGVEPVYLVGCALLSTTETVFDRPFTDSMTITFRQTDLSRIGDEALDVSAQSLQAPIAVAPGATAARTIQLSSLGNARFNVVSRTDSGGDWLSASPESGAVTPFGSQQVVVTLNSGGLAAGGYTGEITVTDPRTDEVTTIPITLIVRGDERALVLSRNGFFFRGAKLRDTFRVVNSGPGDLNWTASVRTLSGGNWLSLSATEGVTSEVAPGPAVEIIADPSAPDVGFQTNFGLVEVRADTANSPRSIVVSLDTTLSFGSRPTIVTPRGFILVSQDGSAVEQTLNLFNPGVDAGFTVEEGFQQQAPWLSVTPTEGPLDAGAEANLTVRARPDGLAPGVFEAEFVVLVESEVFPEFGVEEERIPVQLIVTPSAAAASPAQDGCVPTRLVAVLTDLGLDFNVSQGFPTAIETLVVSDCGTPLLQGAVTAEFSNGDPALSLSSLQNGLWAATWAPLAPVDEMTVEINVLSAEPPLIEGVTKAFGRVGSVSSDSAPIVAPPVSAVSFVAGQPSAPGSYIAVFGSLLAEGSEAAAALPLPETLARSSVLIGGRPAPLLFAGTGQINAVIPWELAANTDHQILIQRGSRISTPVSFSVTSSQPAIFSIDSSGSGQAIVERVSVDGSRSLATAATPARAGEFLVIYASGLGPVDNPPVQARRLRALRWRPPSLP